MIHELPVNACAPTAKQFVIDLGMGNAYPCLCGMRQRIFRLVLMRYLDERREGRTTCADTLKLATKLRQQLEPAAAFQVFDELLKRPYPSGRIAVFGDRFQYVRVTAATHGVLS